MVINTNNLLGLLGFLALLEVESNLRSSCRSKVPEDFLILEVLLPSHSWVPGLAGQTCLPRQLVLTSHRWSSFFILPTILLGATLARWDLALTVCLPAAVCTHGKASPRMVLYRQATWVRCEP